jgi:hypothetical protein
MLLPHACIGAIPPTEWSMGTYQHIKSPAISQHGCMGWS